MNVLFLTYVNRSGSTYLANILSSSADICVCPEGDRLVSIFLEDPGSKFTLTYAIREKLSKVFLEDHKLKLWNLRTEVFTYLEKAETNLDAFRSTLEYYKQSNKPGASHVLFKAERIAALMGKLANAYSTLEVIKNSRESDKILFLSLVRDPRAVFASQKSTRLPGSEKYMAKSPVIAAWKWKQYIHWVLKAKDNNLTQILIKYESLIKEPEQTLSGISGFLSLDLSGCNPEKGDLDPRLSDEEKRIHKRITKPPDTIRLNDWENRLSAKEIYLIDRTGKIAMRKLGYISKSKKLKFALEAIRICSIFGIHLNMLYQNIKFRFLQKEI